MICSMNVVSESILEEVESRILNYVVFLMKLNQREHTCRAPEDNPIHIIRNQLDYILIHKKLGPLSIGVRTVDVTVKLK